MRRSLQATMPGREQGHDQVEQADHRPGLDRHVGCGHELAPAASELGDRDDAGQRGVLEQGDEFVPHGRQNDANRLRQDDVPHGLDIRHAQASGGLQLALGDALNAGAVDLGHVGAIAEGHPKHCHGDGVGTVVFQRREVQGCAKRMDDRRKGVVPVEQLDEQRDAAHQFDVQGGDAPHGLVLGDPPQAPHQADEQDQEEG